MTFINQNVLEMFEETHVFHHTTNHSKRNTIDILSSGRS